MVGIESGSSVSVETVENVNTVVDKALASIGEIATLPEVTIRIIEIVEDDKSTARDLHDVIKNDPALSVKILKVVNSAFYGLPGQVASVDRAIMMLGLSAVKNIAIAASIARLFKGKRISEQFSAADLWRHGLSVAVAGKCIAKLSPNPALRDEIFLAGLIHDLGTLVERQSFPEKFAEVIQPCTDGGVDFAFDAIGVRATNEQILPSVRAGGPGADNHGGMAVLIGIPGNEMTVNPRLFVQQRTFRGSLGATYPERDFPMFLRWHQEGKFPLDKLVTKRYKLDDINEACDDLEAGQILGRAIIEY